LSFVPDRAYDQASRIDALLSDPAVARDLKAADPGADTDEPA
jgi:hypothetical protein